MSASDGIPCPRAVVLTRPGPARGNAAGGPLEHNPVAFMDPYQTLGISRTCSREEVKLVFRVRAWYAHPDRGGESATFIQLCTAYKQILDDLDRRPNPRPTDLTRARR